MVSGRNSTLGGMDSEEPSTVEDLVPTPMFSGKVSFEAPNAISFAPATTKPATPMTHGTLMAEFTAEPQVLRNWSEMLPTKNFVELVVTWPGFEVEWKTPMADMIGGRDHITRAELARFVVDQFSQFAGAVGASSSSNPEWRLGEVSDACNADNTSLAFLWSPAPGMWQPAFRVRNRSDNTKRESSV